jgi:hypothetical protein
MSTPVLVDEPWQVRETRLGIIFGVLLLALLASGLGISVYIVEAILGGMLGYGLAALLVLVWGERTRPKLSPGWVLVVVVWAVLLTITTVAADLPYRSLAMAALLVLATGILARHESGLTPSLLLASGVWAVLFLTGRIFETQTWGGVPQRLVDGDGPWIAAGVIFAIAAATLEHERLVRRVGAGTPTVWTVFRLAFVSVWTILVLSLREDVQWGRLFVVFGADLRGQAGQMLLIGIIAAAIALAAYAFRPAKKKGEKTGGSRPPARR